MEVGAGRFAAALEFRFWASPMPVSRLEEVTRQQSQILRHVLGLNVTSIHGCMLCNHVKSTGDREFTIIVTLTCHLEAAPLPRAAAQAGHCRRDTIPVCRIELWDMWE